MTDWVEQGLKELGPLIKDSGIGWLHIDFRLGEIPDAYEYEGYAASVRFSIYSPQTCLLYTSPSPRDRQKSRMPSSA